MNKYKIFPNKYLKGGLLIASGLLLGWIFFHNSAPEKTGTAAEIHDHEAEGHDVWTCSMHPQIRKDEAGDCPICGMDLVPVNEQSGPEKKGERKILYWHDPMVPLIRP